MCNGSCCEHFVLPISKEILNRWAQQGRIINGTFLETKMISEMVISLGNKPSIQGGIRYFPFTCKYWDKETKKCKVYERRPVLCRTYPDGNKCCEMIKNGCDDTLGTDKFDAVIEFEKAHNLSNKDNSEDEEAPVRLKRRRFK